jgi:hypothetical protein
MDTGSVCPQRRVVRINSHRSRGGHYDPES